MKFRKSSIVNIILSLLIVISTNKWLLEGILCKKNVESICFIVCFVLLAFVAKFRINKFSLIWLMMCLGIVISLLFSGASIGAWGKAGIAIGSIMIFFVINEDKIEYEMIIKTLVMVAIIHMLFVFIHCITKTSFNNWYFPYINDPGALENATRYYRQGYFFGILYAPHELAGILAYSIAYILFKAIVKEHIEFKQIILGIMMLIALLLSGKKGVLGIAFITFLILVTLYFFEQRNIRRVFAVGIGVGTIVLGLYIYVVNHQDSVVFYRILQFINQLNNGETADSGRGVLREYALLLWKQNKMTGIGWGQYIGKTQLGLGYEFGHQVNFDYLQWLCETGIIGFTLNILPVIITLGETVFILLRVVKNIKDNDKVIIILFASFVQIFTVLYAFVEIPFYDIFFFWVYLFSSFIINSTYCRRKQYLDADR